MTKRRALIKWVSADRRRPIVGSTYSTPARFHKIADKWPQEAWSVVLDVDAMPDLDMFDVRISLLAEENAPTDLLDLGSKFQLYDGAHLVGEGEIVP